MNQRVIWLTSLIGLGIIIACSIAAFLYYGGVTAPTLSTQEALQSSISATQTADSISTMRAAIPTHTPSQTPTMTVTVPPQEVTCDATIQGISRAVYPVPGQGHFDSYTAVEDNANVKIIGRLADRGWYKVEVNGTQGWVKSDSLRMEGSCEPTVYDLHHLANWLGSEERLVLEDTFAANQNAWIDATTRDIFSIRSNAQDGAQLEVNTHQETLVTTINPRLASLTAFRLYTSFTVDDKSDQSYVGVRFRDSEVNYYQVILTPETCNVSVYATNNLFYSDQLDPRICQALYYDMILTLSNDYKLGLQVNGYDVILIDLQDPDRQYGQGSIKLVVNQLDVKFDYIVILAPN
jgi:hypothetical protein